MDGASRVFAAPATVTIGGKEYFVKGRIAQHVGEVEQHILSRRPDPLKVFAESAPLFDDRPDLLEKMAKTAMERATAARFATQDEVAAFFDTMEGTAFAIWLSIRDSAADLQKPDGWKEVHRLLLEEVDNLAEALSRDEAERQVVEKVHGAINRASGADPRGNSTGPLSPTVSGATGGTGRSPGGESAGS